MCRSPPSPSITNTNNTNNKPSLVKNTTNNNNNNNNMETPLLHTPPQPAKANKRKRLNAVLDKLAGNMGMESMESMASTMDKMVTSNEEKTTRLEISLSVAEERSTSEESEEERPHSSSSAVSSPKTEDMSYSPSSTSASTFSPSSNPFFSSLINPTSTNSTPPGLDYLKSQLLSKMYLQQYMTNNLTNPVLPPAARMHETPEVRRNPKESRKEGKKLEHRRESKEARRDQLREMTECQGPLDLSRTSGPPSGQRQPSPQPPIAEEVSKKPSTPPHQFPFPPFPSLLLPPSSTASSSSSPATKSKSEEAVSPPPPTSPTKTTTTTSSTTTNSKGVVEASASPPSSTYNCPVCGQKFSLHDRLAKHMASRHKAHKVETSSSSQSKAYFCEVRTYSPIAGE